MSTLSNIFRKKFLQKKLIKNIQIYPYTFIFQYNNISANDWKKIKNVINNLEDSSKINIQIIPSKLRKSLSQIEDHLIFDQNKTVAALKGTFVGVGDSPPPPPMLFSKGRCCLLNCSSPLALNIFYNVITNTLPGKELNISLHFNSFFHIALQSIEKNNQSSILNYFDIKKRLLISENTVYFEFFQRLNLQVLNPLIIPILLTQQILLMKTNR